MHPVFPTSQGDCPETTLRLCGALLVALAGVLERYGRAYGCDTRRINADIRSW
jgi:hypothetical protein